jgi:hypothetical protein
MLISEPLIVTLPHNAMLCYRTNKSSFVTVGCKKIPAESVRLAECVGDVRALLRQILSDSVPSVNITRKTSKSRSLKSEYFNQCQECVGYTCGYSLLWC